MVCKTSEIEITAFGLSPENQPAQKERKNYENRYF